MKNSNAVTAIVLFFVGLLIFSSSIAMIFSG
ncbi:hypothetical protein ERHA54_01500 [Erwinia rhapontici]|uniref:YnhF family membrane protein n=1 Tax=Erwinia rhapontici TaxID=55212 RepID=A0ABM7MUH4_ERWRD|nr:hypothetical protein [Erwinia rhapontici]MCS3608579.1 hypothetical protein [Erwinia rhapontici]TDS98829.1 hypothetical protein EDF84_105165 [Erwinia rhapontici]BCQ32787.1 hypothetical protein ERHA53_01300 [Erwinia rhapontici]BCQ37547.1 hypothetical protein ERHA54_01500 [Erwinia rhapontici]